MAKAARVQRARASALRSTVERQVAVYDDVCPERDARSRRIRTAKRDVERALRSSEQFQESIRTVDAAAGHAIRRLLDEGLTAVDAAVLVRLSRSQIKRLLRLTDRPSEPGTGRSSTGHIPGGAYHHRTRLQREAVLRARQLAAAIG